MASIMVVLLVENVIHLRYSNPVVTPVIAAGSKVVKGEATIKKTKTARISSRSLFF